MERWACGPRVLSQIKRLRACGLIGWGRSWQSLEPARAGNIATPPAPSRRLRALTRWPFSHFEGGCLGTYLNGVLIVTGSDRR